jgi:hypothetical protein
MFRTHEKRGLLPLLMVLVVLGLSAQPALALFEETPASAASRSMGETGVAVVDHAYAGLYNPAQLATVSRGQAAVSYVRPFGYSYNEFMTLGGAVPIDARYGNLGFNVTNFTVNYQDTDLLKETRLTLAHGLTLFEDMHSSIRFGYALNLYRAELATTVSGDEPGDDTALGMDVGMHMTLRKRTHIGFKVQNLNNPDIGVDQEELGRRLIAGIAYEPYDGVVTTFEFDNELGQELQYHGGVAMTVVEGFQLRAGLVTNPNKLTGGFAYSIMDFALDYGFSSGGGTLESTHQFGLRFAWGGEAQ